MEDFEMWVVAIQNFSIKGNGAWASGLASWWAS